MSLRVNTNVSSMNAQASLAKVGREREESFAKLSSGQRITKAADDAAGLAISEKINAEVRSTKQANRNANDGVSLIQIAEGGLNETSALLIRMRELALQAASDTLEDGDRVNSNHEYQAIKNELERISQITEFNGHKLLNGSGKKLDFQVGTGANSTDDQISYESSRLNAGTQALGVEHLSILSKTGAREGLSRVDSAISKVSGQRAILGSLQNRLVSSSNNLMVYSENMGAAKSRIRDVDFAEETANQAKQSIIESAGTAVLAQANTSGQGALKLL